MYTVLLSYIVQSTSGRNRISELENVVAALKRVVEKQQSENESLRRSRPSSKYSQSSLASENKKLKVSQIIQVFHQASHLFSEL